MKQLARMAAVGLLAFIGGVLLERWAKEDDAYWRGRSDERSKFTPGGVR